MANRLWTLGSSKPLFHDPRKMEIRPSVAVGFMGATVTGFSISFFATSTTQVILGALGGFLFFGGLCLWLGLRLVPVGYKALAVWMGIQQLDRYFEAGWKWYVPSPFGGILLVDCQNKNLDIPAKEVLTKDKAPAIIAVSVAYNRGPDRNWSPDKETDPLKQEEMRKKIAEALFNYVITQDAEEQLSQETEDQLRIAVGQIQMDDLVSRKEELTNRVETGAHFLPQLPLGDTIADETEGGPKDGEPEGFKKGIRADVEKFGIHVQSLQITSIRFPPAVEKANEAKLKETAEREAETTERQGNIDAIQAYKKEGMTAAEAAIVHQAERGKLTRQVQTFEGFDLKGVATALGAVLGNKAGVQNQKTQPRRRKRSRAKLKTPTSAS